jgi:hypothetical protein
MFRAQQGYRFAGALVMAALALGVSAAAAGGQIRPTPAALAAASPELRDRLRSDSFAYFRFVNRPWTARVCEAFADVTDAPVVRLHGDAHVEQFALTRNAWGLDDFDDSTRGPEYVDIVRFLASVDLAARQRGWAPQQSGLWDRFFEGYRRGLSAPAYRAPEPDIVRRLRRDAPMSRAAFLARGETQMQPMDDSLSQAVAAGMRALERLIRSGRPALPPGYFDVTRAGWLHIGIGSSSARKILIRVRGRTADPEDDELLEAKEVANLGGVSCLESPPTPPAIRIIDGARQLGRLKHDILAIGPTLLIPSDRGDSEPWVDWWVTSWDPTYREVSLGDLRSVKDLGDIAYDAGVQLGAGERQDPAGPDQALAFNRRMEPRIRAVTVSLVEEMLASWRELKN